MMTSIPTGLGAPVLEARTVSPTVLGLYISFVPTKFSKRWLSNLLCSCFVGAADLVGPVSGFSCR